MAKVDIFFQSTKLMGKKWVERAKLKVRCLESQKISKSDISFYFGTPIHRAQRRI